MNYVLFSGTIGAVLLLLSSVFIAIYRKKKNYDYSGIDYMSRLIAIDAEDPFSYKLDQFIEFCFDGSKDYAKISKSGTFLLTSGDLHKYRLYIIKREGRGKQLNRILKNNLIIPIFHVSNKGVTTFEYNGEYFDFFCELIIKETEIEKRIKDTELEKKIIEINKKAKLESEKIEEELRQVKEML